jgi:hypothetical protein
MTKVRDSFDPAMLEIARKQLERDSPVLAFLRECHGREERIINDRAVVWGADAVKRATLRLDHQRKMLRELYAVKAHMDEPNPLFRTPTGPASSDERQGMLHALAFQAHQFVGEYDDFPGWREEYRPPTV